MSRNLNRRCFLRSGLGAGVTLSLADLARLQAADAKSNRSAIFIYLDGGQSHIDSWDPKPEGGEAKGEFKPIQTSLAGFQVCEHMPKLAKLTDHYAVVRGVHEAIGVHGLGMTLVRSGNRPRASLTYPDLGSVIAKECPSPQGVPPFVSLPMRTTNAVQETPGYLGVAYRAFVVREDPNAATYSVRALNAPAGFAPERSAGRADLLEQLDTAYRGVDLADQNIAGMDRFYQQAFDVLRSTRTREAFDILRESAKVRDTYGRSSLGQACLLARRLVEAGVRCVTIDYGGWDTHQNNFTSMKGELLPTWDTAMAALLDDLRTRGMLESTLVWSTGEMGRTPTINPNSGRDHWGKAMSMMLAGGGIKGGVVMGATDKQGADVIDGACKPEDVAATVLQTLGIDPRTEYPTPTGRPINLNRDGKILTGLLA